jgi:hypothetical protein
MHNVDENLVVVLVYFYNDMCVIQMMITGDLGYFS